MRILLLITVIFFSCSLSANEQQENIDIYQQIKSTLERNMFTLPPRVQGHYGIRLYRLTGEERYLPSALYDYYVVQDRVNYLVKNQGEKDFIARYAKQLTNELSKGKRGKLRRKSLKTYPEFIFYADAMLRYSARLNEFGLVVPESIKSALSEYDFLTPLTDSNMIHAWAAQLANYVYWLKQLGIADHRDAYKAAFKKAYPDNNDASLSKSQFKNKLYGMTHFIFAASSYYQHYVDLEEFGWILAYFHRNEERIFKQASADIMAEIGISHLLLKSRHAMLAKTQASVKKAFDPAASFIPSISGKIIYSSGEHRNVLAMMLLSWPETLHQGPKFKELTVIKQQLPQFSLQ